MYKVAIITLSDRASSGVYVDKSGAYLSAAFEKAGYDIVIREILPDDEGSLIRLLNDATDLVDLIITTGGTGLSSRDITVKVIEKLMDYEVRGMSIALHQYSLEKSKGAMFSRALCAVIKKTLVITMPGSLKAVKELSQIFIPHLKHGLDHLHDIDVHNVPNLRCCK